VSIGTMNIVSPEYFGTSQSVRVMQIAISDKWPAVVHTF